MSILGSALTEIETTAPDIRWRYIGSRVGIGLILLLCGTFALTRVAQPPRLWGDGAEYAYMLQSWYNHGTPDLRAEELHQGVPFPTEARRDPLTGIIVGYYQAKDGAYFSYHFWFYSLSALPAYAVLRALNQDTGHALPFTNML